jgi:hypothetical protein
MFKWLPLLLTAVLGACMSAPNPPDWSAQWQMKTDHDLEVNERTLEALRALREEPKFHAAPEVHYSGAPDERIRRSAEAKINALITRLIQGAPQNPKKSYVLSEFKPTLNELYWNDSEDRDRALDYIEAIMDIFGIESSDGMLNRWRYGMNFDAPE